MNVIVVDTSSWILYFRGQNFSNIDLALKEGRVFLPPIVAAELLSGALNRKQRENLLGFINELPFCDTPPEHWIKVGTLRAMLYRQGFSVSTPDAHIAQCCLDLDGYLLTQDKIFKKVAALIKLRMISR